MLLKTKLLAALTMVSLFFASAAFAQNALSVPGLDFVSWGASLLTFSGALTLFTQAVKQRFKKRLDHTPDWIPKAVSIALGIAISYGIDSRGLLLDPMFSGLPGPYNWIAYGALAGIGSIGFFEILATFLGKPGTKPTGFDPSALPQTPEDLLEIVANSSIAVDVKRRAVEALKLLNPAAGMAAELLLKQLLTRPLTDQEGKRALENEVVVAKGA